LRTFSTESRIGHVREAHRRSVAVGDHEVAILGRAGRLVVGVQLVALVADVDRALGGIGIGGRQRRPDILEPDAVLEQRVGIQLDPHRRERAATDLHLADAAHLRQLLREDGVGGVVHLPGSERLGGQGEDHHRRIGRIDLVIGGIAAQRARQVRARRVDRGLDVARRAVDVAVETELQGDVGRAG